MATRKEVKEILMKHGFNMKFTLRTVSFAGFGYDDAQVCTLKVLCYSSVDWDKYDKAKAELKPLRVILNNEGIKV